MTYFEGMKPTMMEHREAQTDDPVITREELIVLLIRAGAAKPDLRFGELISHATRPGTGAPALRNVTDEHLARLLRDLIHGRAPQGLSLS